MNEGNNKMKTYTLKRDGQRNLTFLGEEVAATSSKSMSGPNQSRWTEHVLYKTSGGKFILYTENVSCWQNESDDHEATVCFDENAVVTALLGDDDSEHGYISDIAKELLDEAGIDADERVE